MLRDGKEVGVELETVSSNFLAHKHDINKVDEILCLVKDVELGKPVKEVKQLTFEGNRKVTLSIESEVYEKFKKYCEEHAFILSKKLELGMKKELENEK